MLTNLVKIGNSRGVRIPKALLESAKLTGPVELVAQDGAVLIRPVLRTARDGWERAFQAAVEQEGPVELLLPDHPSQFDEEDWEWK